MDSTFFRDLEEISTRQDLQITVKTKDGIMSVLVMPKAITLTGSPAELDAGFLEAIKKPLEKSEGLTVSTSKADTAVKVTGSTKSDAKKTPDAKPSEKKVPTVKTAPVDAGLFATPEDDDEKPEEIGGEVNKNE